MILLCQLLSNVDFLQKLLLLPGLEMSFVPTNFGIKTCTVDKRNHPLYAKVQKRSKTEPTLTTEDITGYQLRIAPPDKLPLAPKQQEDD